MARRDRKRRIAIPHVNSHRSPRWIVPVVVGLGIAAAGLLSFVPYWIRPPAEKSAKTSQEQPADQPPSEAPFSAPTTVEGLKHEARQVVAELAATFPDQPEPLNVLGLIESNLGNTEEAVAAWERCAKRSPGLADPIFSLATVAKQEGDYEKAAELYRRAGQLVPGDPNAPVLLAGVLITLGRAQEAVDLLEARIRQGSGSPAIFSPLGHAYLQLEQFAKARDALEKVVQAAPSEKNAWYGLAKACARLGNQARAKECMERFRTLSAEDQKKNTGRIRAQDDMAEMRRLATNAQHEAAKIYFKYGQVAKAEELWRRAALLDPMHIESRMALASVYARTNRPLEALKIYQDLCEAHPDRADLWLYVGVLSAHLGRMTDAQTAVEKAVQLDPKNPKYHEVLQSLRKAG
ncbi:MAG: tetratricopeptide repeat protein [Thermoguttaceae bacterium]